MMIKLMLKSYAFELKLFLRPRHLNYRNIFEVKFSVVGHVKEENFPRIPGGISFSNVNFDETDYYFDHGLRRVYPYYYDYSTFCKKHWIDRSLVDIFSDEFILHNSISLEERILSGKIRVNGRQVPVNYKLKHADHISSCIHRHEIPVLAVPIKVIHIDDEVVVVDKPPSIPVHPCGLYRHNSALFILAKEENLKGLHIVNRLDCVTSGLVLFVKNSVKANELAMQMCSRKIQKEYICKVDGLFPDGIVTCDQAIKMISHKISFSIVNSGGKPSYTEFVRIGYDGKESLLLCRPMTGRTHQIRVHLHFLGFPIVNDPLYNHHVLGPQSEGRYSNRSLECLKSDILKHFKSSISEEECLIPQHYNHFEKYSLHNYISLTEYHQFALKHTLNLEKAKLSTDADCSYCNSVFKDPVSRCMNIFLHAYRYKGDGWEYTSELPNWAKQCYGKH